MKRLGLSLIAGLLASCSGTTTGPAATAAAPTAAYDLLITNGLIYDGAGGAPYRGEVGITGDRIAFVGAKAPAGAVTTVDAGGKAVAPGFINMLSHSREALLHDGRAMSGVLQGVTLEVNSENSLAPLTENMRRLREGRQGDLKLPLTWSTLGGYFDAIENSGVSVNVASFIGAGAIREHVLGLTDVDPSPAQLDRMRGLVRAAMQDGALGVTTMLIYIPERYAETPELIALMQEAGKCGGMYISHMRNEGDHIQKAIDELITIARESKAPAEIYHLKLAGQNNWGKLDAVIAQVEKARSEGIRVTADMYTYTAGATGLDASMPLWVQDGGLEKWIERLKDPATRAKVHVEMRQPGQDWENLMLQAGSPEKVILIAFKNPALKKYTGKTLAEVAKERGTSPEDTAIDLVIEDGSRVGTAYFLMDEANVRRQVGLPWMSFGSDEEAPATTGVFTQYNNHPRAFGNFARVLGKYVREDKAATLPDAIRRLSAFPAENLGIKDRGSLKKGHFADVVVFDPATIADHSTFQDTRRYSTGMRDVFVNGVQVLKGGEHTGAKPGRVVRGPGAGRCG